MHGDTCYHLCASTLDKARNWEISSAQTYSTQHKHNPSQIELTSCQVLVKLGHDGSKLVGDPAQASCAVAGQCRVTQRQHTNKGRYGLEMNLNWDEYLGGIVCNSWDSNLKHVEKFRSPVLASETCML